MKPQDSVTIVAGTLKLPPSVTTYLQSNISEFEDDNSINGGVLQDTRYAWLSSGSKFTVIDVQTGQKTAAWTFGAVLRDFKTKVTCVCELPSPLIDQTMQLLIGLECDLIGGMICLFHCNGSRVCRAIQVDCRVTCMKYIEELPGGPLDCFDGAVLIGTHGGAALIIDFNRQSCIEAIVNGCNGNEALIKNELNIANLVVLSIDDISLIVEQRTIACNKDDHIAVQVNEGCIHNLQYILHNPDNTVRLRTLRENIFITCILYVPQLTSVIVGLNIGAFQIWNLVSLELEFTSQVNADGLPVSHLAFLEPCDDPRAFCYLWASYSTLDKHEEGFALAAMYALTYQGKTLINGQGSVYQMFASCHLRFNIELTCIESTNAALKQMIGGRTLACHSLNKAANKVEDGDESVLNICQIVWECWTVSAIAPMQYIMILFDIDQWYKEQMPDCSTLETNSYMSVVNLGDTLAHTASSYLCDVRIKMDTLTPYLSVQRLEEHFYPNSLGYECICLTNNDITCLSTMGVQRQILASIYEIGPSVLLHPAKLFQQCISTGLIPLYIEPSLSSATPLHIQRQVLLSIALEARLVQFLGKCAGDWATGSHSSVGCSLHLLTDWAWTRALSLKQNGNQLTIPLFDHSGDLPDRNAVRCLDNCTRQLGHIATLLNIILEKCSLQMMPEAIQETKQRQKAVQVVSLYFQVVQWFLNVGLLPEFNMDHQIIQMGEDNIDRLPYPVDSLIQLYQERRYKLHCLNGENPANEDLQNKSCTLLFIDQFMKMECSEKRLKKFWMEDGSSINSLYPPPSLYSLLRTYLIPEIKEEHKHSLVLYVLVDYAMMFDHSRYEGVIRRLMQFPTMFGLSNTAIKVTEAFWHLDHRDFEFALDQLQCVLDGGCLTQWQHNVVLSALIAQKKNQAALQYLHVRKPCVSSTNGHFQGRSSIVYDDWEACCNLYLSRGLVLEAFNLIKDSFTNTTNSETREQRLIAFFEGSRNMGLMPKVLQMSLMESEENTLVKFLKAVGDTDSHNLLVTYYLQRSRYIEAQQINEDLKHLKGGGPLPYDITSDFSMKKKHIHKTKTRDQLVELYCKTLPKITRHLAQYASGNILGHKMSMPTPMTVNLQANVLKPVAYKSSFIEATIEKASETWMDNPTVARGLKRTLQVEETPFICTPKMGRHSFSRNGPVERMITTPEDKCSPPKRSKSNNSTLDGEVNFEEEVIDPKLKKEMEVLLHTPVIERKSHWRPGSNISGRFSLDTREATPQSILKVRSLLNRATTPLHNKHLVETDDELETASQHTQSDNLSRSIRFNIPSASNSPSPSECGSDLNVSYNNVFGVDTYNQDEQNKSPVSGVSSRKSIHYACDTHHTAAVISTPIKRKTSRGRQLSSASSPNLNISSVDTSISEERFYSPPTIHSTSYKISRSNSVSPDMTTDDNSVNEAPQNIDDLFECQFLPSEQENIEALPHVSVSIKRSPIEEAIRIEFIKSDNLLESNTNTVDVIASREKLLLNGPQPRRSLRSSQSSERILDQDKDRPLPIRRSLRSRSRTPEIDISNVSASPSRLASNQSNTKKSLARKVLEANTLSKTIEMTSPTISNPRRELHYTVEKINTIESEEIQLEKTKCDESFMKKLSFSQQNTSLNSDSILNSDVSNISFENNSISTYPEAIITHSSIEYGGISAIVTISDNDEADSEESNSEKLVIDVEPKSLNADDSPLEEIKTVEEVSLVDESTQNSLLASDSSHNESLKVDEESSVEGDLQEKCNENKNSPKKTVDEDENFIDVSSQEEFDIESAEKESVDDEPEVESDADSGSILEESDNESDKDCASRPESSEEGSQSKTSSEVASNKSSTSDNSDHSDSSQHGLEVENDKNSEHESSYYEESSEDAVNKAYLDSPSEVICVDESSDEEIIADKNEVPKIIENTDSSKPEESNDQTPVIETDEGNAVEIISDKSAALDIAKSFGTEAFKETVTSSSSIVPKVDNEDNISNVTEDSLQLSSQRQDIYNMSLMTEEESSLQNEPSSISLRYSDDEEQVEVDPILHNTEENSSEINNAKAITRDIQPIEVASTTLADKIIQPDKSIEKEKTQPIKTDNVLIPVTILAKTIQPIHKEKGQLDENLPLHTKKDEISKDTEVITMGSQINKGLSTAAVPAQAVQSENDFNIKKDEVNKDTEVIHENIPTTIPAENVHSENMMKKEENKPIDNSLVHIKKYENSHHSIVDNTESFLNTKNKSQAPAELPEPFEVDNNISQNVSIPSSVDKNILQKLPVTPQRRSQRRSSVSSDGKISPNTTNVISSSPDSVAESDTSIAKSTRSASKRKSLAINKPKSTPRKFAKELETVDNESAESHVSLKHSLKSASVHETETSDADDFETVPSSRRKSRRSILTFIKPNLSVIPEISQYEDDKSTVKSTTKDSILDASNMVEQYSSNRRLTRHQKSILERSIQNSPSGLQSSQHGSSAHNDKSDIIDNAETEAADISARTNTPEKTLTEALDKPDFFGLRDLDEQSYETDSLSSNNSFTPSMKQSRRGNRRAVSETGFIGRTRLDIAPSPSKHGTPTRILSTPTRMLDESALASPSGRPRRTSFNKAVEALSTPRRTRRHSDSKNDTDGGSDTSTADRNTPDVLKGRLNESGVGTESKLDAIAEDEDVEVANVNEMPSPKLHRKRKAASVHGDMMSIDSPESRRSYRRGRISQLLTPLSKEEQLKLAENERPQYRRRTGTHKIIRPLQFVVKKK